MDFTGKGLGIDGQDAISGALTLNLGVLRITPDGLEALLDIRHPVLMNGEMIRRIVGLRLEDLGIRVETASYKAPLHVPEQSRIVSSLLKVYHEVTGNEPRAIAIGGGTYSRSMDNWRGLRLHAAGPSGPGAPGGRAYGAGPFAAAHARLCARHCGAGGLTMIQIYLYKRSLMSRRPSAGLRSAGFPRRRWTFPARGWGGGSWKPWKGRWGWMR